MEYQIITNLIGTTSDNVYRCINKNWIEVYDHSGSGSVEVRYKPSKQLRFKISLLRSDLCDFSNACIVVQATLVIEEGNNVDLKNRSLTLKNNAPSISCISKINIVLIDNAEDLDVVMLIYNLIEYSKNYKK